MKNEPKPISRPKKKTKSALKKTPPVQTTLLSKKKKPAKKIVKNKIGTLDNANLHKLERELRETKERLHLLTEATEEGIAIHDKGIILDANDALARIFGYELSEIIGMKAERLTTPESWKVIKEHISTGYDKPYEGVGVRKDGSTFICSLVGKPYKYKDRTLRLSTFHDITERKKAEDELQREGNRFRALAEQSSDIIVFVNREGIVTYENPAVEKFLGFKPEERIGVNVFDRIHPDDFKLASDAFNAWPRDINAPVPHFEIRLLHKDGSWRTFETVGSKIVNNNIVETVIVNLRDITERKLADEAVKVNHAQMLAIFDAIDEPVYVADTETHEILYINKATNLAWGDLEDRKCFEYLQNRKRPCSFCTNSKILGEYSGRSYVWEFQNEVNNRWYRCIDKAISWPDGRLVRYEMAVDITERKRAEEEIKSAKVFLDMVIDMSPFAMWISDKEGTITRVNLSLCNVINLKEDEIVGKYNVLKDLNLEIQGVMPLVRAVFEKHEPARFIIPWKAADAGDVDFKGARDMYIDVSIFPILNAQGELTNVVCQWVDITERKKSEEALEKYREHLEDLVRERTIKLEASNKELEAFSYSASHDLRAPLRTIDGFSQALLEDCEDKLDIQGKDYLIRIKAATRRMADLIEDLLQLSRVARTEMNIEKINLTRIAQSIIDELQKSQPQRHVEIKIADGLEDTADSRLMRITLDNLLGNAWKFTEKQAKAVIEFGCTKEGKKKVYFIRDNGAGFDMAYADKLFAPFQRLHNEEEFPGTGIGLALVRRIIHRHGGKVWAEGQTGKGATFYFNLNEK